MSSAEKKLVRLIDDDPMVLKAMKSVLVEEGFEVKTYLTAEDFLTEADSTHDINKKSE